MQWDHRTRFRVLKTPNNRTRPEDRIPCGDLDKRAWWKRIPFKVTATNTANSFPSTCTHPRGAEVTKTPGRNSIYSLSHSLQGPARVLPPSPRSPRSPSRNFQTPITVPLVAFLRNVATGNVGICFAQDLQSRTFSALGAMLARARHILHVNATAGQRVYVRHYLYCVGHRHRQWGKPSGCLPQGFLVPGPRI